MDNETHDRMSGCCTYREIDPVEYHIDAERVRSLQDSWGVSITREGKVRIPVCYYDDVLPLLSRRKPPGNE